MDRLEILPYNTGTAAARAKATDVLMAAVVVLAIVSMIICMPPHIAHAEQYTNDKFKITYPDGWSIKQDKESVSFVSGITKDSITISHHDEYPIADMWGAKTLEIDKVDLDVVEAIAEDAANICRMNLLGICWSFEQVDSRITTISHTKAALVDFDARIDDSDTSVRIIALPTDSGVWVLRGIAKTSDTQADAMQAVRDALDTFEPAGLAADDDAKKSPSAATQSPERWIPDDPDLVLEKEIIINMIMIGQKWSSIDIARILEELPAYNDPIFTTTGEKVGIRYHYTYNFVSDAENTEELLRVMDENSRKQPIFGSGVYDFDFWQATWVQNHPHLKDAQYRLVDAVAVEEYIRDAIIGTNRDVDRSDSAVSLVFLNIPYDDSQHIQNYYMETADRSTEKKVDYVGLMGFGGNDNDNMFVFDMWAVPWADDVYMDFLYLPVNANNMHDCQRPDCTTSIVLGHTESAAYQILTPSFLYPVTFHDNYFLDILVYLKPGGRVTVTPAVLDHFMNKDEIIREMQYLYPYAGWDIELSIERKDMRGLSLEFKKQFEKVRKEQVDVLGRTVQYAYLNSSEITPHLVEWAQQRQAERQLISGNDTWAIPILVVIDNTDAEVRIDGGAIGIAPGMPEDKSQPCCALAVADATDIWENEIALDNLILHEAGHVMGLHHSFVSFKYGEPSYDYYFNWYSSPMTYSMPGGWSACGLLYVVFYDDTCGNANTSFTKFERERLADARLVSLLKKIENGTSDMPAVIAEQVAANVTDIKREFATGGTSSKTSALQEALAIYDMTQSSSSWADAEYTTGNKPDMKADAATSMPQDSEIQQQAEELGTASSDENIAGDVASGIVQVQPSKQQAEEPGMMQDDNEDHNQGETTHDGAALAESAAAIPAWVKNSAGWWSQGLIDDHEFISSIEYMISNNIMSIDTGGADPHNDADSNSVQSIPAWVKNSAGWWSEGLLEDGEFVNSLKYLISSGMIRV